MYRKFLNMGTSKFIYSSLNERTNVVGLIDPPFLDFNNLPESDLFNYRECKCKIENDKPFKKNGKSHNFDFNFYITDYLWLLCNFSCPYCLTDSPEHTKLKTKSIDVEKRLNWLRYFTAHKEGTYCYRMFGGEPTIYAGFDQIVDFINQDETCISCKISSNASKFDKFKIFFQDNMNCEKFLFDISIHPSDKKFDWSQTKKIITQMYEANYSIFLIGVDVPENAEKLKEYSSDLEKSLGISIAVFENLREDKYK